MSRDYYMDEQLANEDWTPLDLGKPVVYIYGLIDPRTLECRYVGKSIRPKGRVADHMNDRSKCHRTHWLNELREAGLWPDLLILETVNGAWPWQESERFWIAYGKAQGWPLTNNTSGGDGVPDLPLETRERIRKAWLGRKCTPEHVEKTRRAKLGTKASAETRAKMSRAHKGRIITWGSKLSAAVSSVTDEQAREIKRRRAAGEKVIALAKEYGVHRTTITNIVMGHYRWKDL